MRAFALCLALAVSALAGCSVESKFANQKPAVHVAIAERLLR